MKSKIKGFTIIELMIVVAIIGIIAALLLGPKSNGDGSYCSAGYKWVSDANGTAHQVFGENQQPVPCQ